MRYCLALCALLFGSLGIAFSQSEQPGSALAGIWASNLSKSQLPANYQYRSLTLQFAFVLDTVTVGSTFVQASGQQASATELFHLDGKSHPGTLNPGVIVSAKWASPRKLETHATKDRKDAGTVTYEVSSDGKTLTSRYSTSPTQVVVFDRK